MTASSGVGTVMGKVVLALTILLPAAAVGQSMELRGRLEPPVPGATVTLWGATRPFSGDTVTDAKGRFRFRGVPTGSYTLHIVQTGMGEVRRTVNVTPSRADAKGRMEVVVAMAGAEAGAVRVAERSGKVSLRELRIPEKARSAYAEALKRLGRQDAAGAVAKLQEAVKVAPAFTEAWNNLGTIAYQSGRYGEAEQYFRQGLEHDPGAYAPTVNLGGVLLNLGRPKEALPYNEYAVREQPEDALAHSQLGMTYAALGEAGKAERELLEAIRLDAAHFSTPQLVLAKLYVERGRREEAARQLESYLAVHPESPVAVAEAVRRDIARLRGR